LLATNKTGVQRAPAVFEERLCSDWRQALANENDASSVTENTTI